MKTLLLIGSSIAALCGCDLAQVDRRPFVGTLPQGTALDMAGTFALSAAGELTLTLRSGCASETSDPQTNRRYEGPCNRAEREAIRVIAVTPWADQVRGRWLDPKHIVFHVEWANAKLDVLADDARVAAARPWTVSGVDWQPLEGDSRRILKLVGDATETETELVRGGAAPKLDVTAIELSEGTLRAGRDATLVLQMANHGPGVAYRVAATTRSSLPALHGRRLEFGVIKPGAEKVRRLHFEVPAGETSPDAMVVLVLSEGNGFAPTSVSRRWPVKLAEPELSVACVIPGRPQAKLELDGGELVTVRCVVGNTGSSPAKPALELSINGAAPVRSAAQAVPAPGHVAFEVPIAIPRDLAVNAKVQIAITARDPGLDRAAETTLTATVRKPRLCVPGQLTRAQYQAKVSQLRAAVSAGDLTQAQLDRYEAELLVCLK